LNFKLCIQDIVSKTEADFILWGVDDVMYFKDVDLHLSLSVLHENEDLISSTLRLAPQMSYCHTVDKTTIVPPGIPTLSTVS
jgi:hypothetical protein